ncbi:MAG: hypothetical protein VCC99_15575 [Alphaproteobacteria bacterium]
MAHFARIFALGAIVLGLAFPPAIADDTPSLESRIGDVFLRSMLNWRYDYAKMDTVKAGVACIPWDSIDTAYLDEAIFDALGFSFSVARDDAAVHIATQGCEQMKARAEISGCACEAILIDDRTVVTIPEDAAARLR